MSLEPLGTEFSGFFSVPSGFFVLIDEYDKPMKYVLSYRDDKRQVHKIGVNISSASRTVIYTNCIILGR